MPPARDRLAVKQVVFSGDGRRCCWHGGFLEVVAPSIELESAAGVIGGRLSVRGDVFGPRAGTPAGDGYAAGEHAARSRPARCRAFAPADKIDIIDPGEAARTGAHGRRDGGAIPGRHGRSAENIH
jgi:hypothetical protein